MGQCFWKSTGDQCSWYRRKNLALQHLLPSTIHSEQGSRYAWATHTEIAAFAQGASTRVIVISPSQGCIYCFEPPAVKTTLHILHHHDHFERISNFQGKAFHAKTFHACHFHGGPALFPLETVCHPGRQAALQTTILKGGVIRAKAPPLAACRDLSHWIQATYALHGIPMTPQGDRPISNTPLSYLPPQARYDDGLSHPSTLKAGGKTGGKKAGLRKQWADESDGKATDTKAEEEKRGIDAQMGSDPTAPQRVKEEPPDDDMDEESWAGQSACDDDFLLGDFEAKPSKYPEEPRNLSPEEITREVGEPVALNASLLIEENSLPDPPVGIAGYVSYKGERTLVYPPLLGLARLAFFRDQENDPPYFPPGFYCLFCRWRLNGGQWAKKYDNFTSLLQHMSSGWVRCCDPKIYHFYKKQYQWHRRAFFKALCEQGLYLGDAPHHQIRPAQASLGKINPNPTYPCIVTTQGVVDQAQAAFHKASSPVEPPGPPPKTSFPTKATSSSQPSKPTPLHRGAKADEDSDLDTHMSYESRDLPSAAAASKNKSGLSDKARRKHSRVFPDDESADASMESEYDEVIFDITNKPYFKHARNKKKDRIYVHLDLGNPSCAPGANPNAQLAWLKMFEGTTVKELNASGFRTYRSIEGKPPPLRLKGSSTLAVTDANSKHFVCTFRASCTLHVDQEGLSQDLKFPLTFPDTDFTKVSEAPLLQPQAGDSNNFLFQSGLAQVLLKILL